MIEKLTDTFQRFYSESADICSDFYRWERHKGKQEELRLKADILALHDSILQTKKDFPDWEWDEV